MKNIDPKTNKKGNNKTSAHDETPIINQNSIL